MRNGRRWRLAGFLSAGAVMLFALFSTDVGALILVKPLEQLSPQFGQTRDTDTQAIVVLGGSKSVERMRVKHAAQLQRETGLPVLISGPSNSIQALEHDFRISIRWIDGQARNTVENAKFSKTILEQAGVKKIYLVTDAIHMPRAKAIFSKVGFEVITAPAMFYSREAIHPSDFIPSGKGLFRSGYALHEWIGIAWYFIRYGST